MCRTVISCSVTFLILSKLSHSTYGVSESKFRIQETSRLGWKAVVTTDGLWIYKFLSAAYVPGEIKAKEEEKVEEVEEGEKGKEENGGLDWTQLL